MRLNKHHHTHTLGFNMTPMIDVVFLLIIFFMTVSQISRINAHHIQLPEVSAAPTIDEPITISLTIDAQGDLFEHGNRITFDLAVARVQSVLSESENDPSRVVIQIRCDRRATSNSVNQLVRALAALGIKQIRTAILER